MQLRQGGISADPAIPPIATAGAEASVEIVVDLADSAKEKKSVSLLIKKKKYSYPQKGVF